MKDNNIKIEYISSETQQADMLTKVLLNLKFYKTCKAVGLY